MNTHKSMEEILEKYWNLKPKKKVTGEGIVVSFTKEELDQFIEAYDSFAQQQVQEAVGEWHLGKKISAFGGEYVVVGLSQMVYDEDCEGEPEWKITKEVQKVAIAKEYAGISYQKPSWHNISTLKSKLEDNK